MTRNITAVLCATLVATIAFTHTANAQRHQRFQALTSGSGSLAEANDAPPEVQLIPVGLSDNQTLRIVALNLSKDETPTVTVKFVDNEGNTLLQGAASTIQPDQLATSDLDRSIVAGTGRIEARAIVTITEQGPPGTLRLSLEVFNNATGQTTVLWAGPSGPPPPPRQGRR